MSKESWSNANTKKRSIQRVEARPNNLGRIQEHCPSTQGEVRKTLDNL